MSPGYDPKIGTDKRIERFILIKGYIVRIFGNIYIYEIGAVLESVNRRGIWRYEGSEFFRESVNFSCIRCFEMIEIRNTGNIDYSAFRNYTRMRGVSYMPILHERNIESCRRCQYSCENKKSLCFCHILLSF